MPRTLLAPHLLLLAALFGCGGTLYRGGAGTTSSTPPTPVEASPVAAVRAPDVLGTYTPPSVSGSAANQATIAGQPAAAVEPTDDRDEPSVPSPVALSADVDVYAPEADVDVSESTSSGVFSGLLDEGASASTSAPRYARADPQASPPPPSPVSPPASPASAPRPDATATDAIDLSGPILVYTAGLTLAVYKVEESQDAIIEAVEGLGGYVSFRDDSRVTLRVPSEHFDEALSLAGERGDVLSRHVQSVDVGEEFNDLRVRLANAEAMRKRIEQLLDRAANIQEALMLERELQRITEIIESLKGRIRFLADRATFSTIDVHFRPIPEESIHAPGGVELPIAWLRELGLSTLLDLRRESDD